MKLSAFFVAGLLALVPVAGANQILFDELGTASPVSANNLHIGGVLFQFNGGSAQYNAAIGSDGTTALVSDPLLAGGTSGILKLTFDYPTLTLRFGVVMESAETLAGAYTVTIPGYTPFIEDTAPIVLFSEGEFVYTGSTPVSTAVITFSDAAPAFGMDNLTFDACPEPATALLLGGASLGLSVLSRRRKR